MHNDALTIAKSFLQRLWLVVLQSLRALKAPRIFFPLSALIMLVLINHLFFASPAHSAQRFVVPVGASDEDSILALLERRVIKNKTGFIIALRLQGISRIAPGAYDIPAGVDAFGIAYALKSPSSLWVTIAEGLRKEEIARVLQRNLSWSDGTKAEFLNAASNLCAEELGVTEGCLSPDTYLIPVRANADAAAKILLNQFRRKFSPFVPELISQNVKYSTAVNIASLVQREAGSLDEMPLIAGIIWNRLLIGMKLNIDATLQYAKGSEETGWWPRVLSADKTIDSLYNTYMHLGLPPAPIANPGLHALEAAVFPEQTRYMYYLHDPSGAIHFAVTYEEHKANIRKYLR